jgi:glycosyltransferase involved in cell wall biosynthesis
MAKSIISTTVTRLIRCYWSTFSALVDFQGCRFIGHSDMVTEMDHRASIVIPAHNEESRIRSILQTLTEPTENGTYAIFVICNGCTDRTRQVAEEFEGVKVAEVAEVGKHFALNEGDRLADGIFPRLYCDADIRTDPKSIAHFVEQLTTDEVVVAGPTVEYDVSQSSWGIKKCLQALQIPVITEWSDAHLTGRGVYGTSREARKRFDKFPPLLADDAFFDSQYDPTEKLMLSEAVVTIESPTTLRQLVKIKARDVQGLRDLASYKEGRSQFPGASTATSTLGNHHRISRITTLRRWVKDIRPSNIVSLVVYLSIKVLPSWYLVVLRLRRRKVGWR